MATLSNRDRVGKAFELLRDGLLPFIGQTIDRLVPAADWAAMLTESKGKPVDAEDVQSHLMLLTEKFMPLFKEQLPFAARNYASELRDQRNNWAHLKAFSNDDAHRMLENAERLLVLVGAVEQAEAVRTSRLDHQRGVFEAETKKLVKQQDATVNVSGEVAGRGLKPWREVLQPHHDVATGNFSSSEFAADLHEVAFPKKGGSVGVEYTQPAEFFRRTYLTEGLRDLLDGAIQRITGDANASPIINLQTNFGGGKTHSMLALYHLFSGAAVSSLPQDIQDLVAVRSLPAKVNRVVLVGTHLKPTGSLRDGTQINTLWGELAWQLGGAAAYMRVAAADKAKTNPGDLLRDLIADYGPCLILIDEWVAYARQLWGREDLEAGTFDTQFTFAQALTEVVKSIPGALLVISIPASHDPQKEPGEGGSAIEVGGPNGQEALQRLQNVVRRVAVPWRPASSQESFEIVRRRLFTEPSAAALGEIAAVARQYSIFYANHRGEFPREVTLPEYEARIKAAYPLHPELFDRLYEDWSTLERFQRTRGVLRLMSTVVHALWRAQDASPMIMPGTVPLDVSTVTSEITQYLPDAWKPIIDRDIDGDNSTSAKIDVERPLLGARAMTRRLARTIFIGAAPTLNSPHKGIERQRLWLGAAIPGDTVGNFGSGLELLFQRSNHIYEESSRYWYDTQASVARTAGDYADSLRDRPEVVWAEIVSRLQGERRQGAGFASVTVAPASSAEIKDADETRLVILHPSQPHTKDKTDSVAAQWVRDAFERCGTAQRSNRNMVVFLAPDSKRLPELEESTRSYLAWSWVAARKEELNLTPQQLKQVESNVQRNSEDVNSRIYQSYHWVLVPEQPDPAAPAFIGFERAEGAGSLAKRVLDRLVRQGLMTTLIAPLVIRMDLEQRLRTVWERGHISVGELWGYYCKYPYLTRMRDRSVLATGISEALTTFLTDDGFALAHGYDEATGQYIGLRFHGSHSLFGDITDSVLLVHPDTAQRQVDAEKAAQAAPQERERSSVADPGGSSPSLTDASSERQPGADGEHRATVSTKRNTRFFGVYEVDPERYGRDLTRVSQEILHQLAAAEGASLRVTVEIHAVASEGFSDDKVRVVLENARTLKFTQSSFEDN
ncbi:DUF499 domain-containing protein [Pseudarthrobacter oxydans]|uniref:DUF499 domain-containing protein n=1 Tax=Pseudarthrobacter oxydans TaxID=1671 RepID=UPI00381EED5A